MIKSRYFYFSGFCLLVFFCLFVRFCWFCLFVCLFGVFLAWILTFSIFFFFRKTVTIFLLIILCECHQQAWNLCMDSLAKHEARLVAANTVSLTLAYWLPHFWCVLLTPQLLQCHRSCTHCLCQTPSYFALPLFLVPVSPRAKLLEELERKVAWTSLWSKEGHGHMYWGIMQRLVTFLLAILCEDIQIKLHTSAVIFSTECKQVL